MFDLPKLPYAYSDLEPVIDEKTMMIHHTKHHQAYIDKLNLALADHADLQSKSLEELLSVIDQLPEGIRVAVRNHAGGHHNHSLFWLSLNANGGGEPEGKLAKAIGDKFESFEKFKEEFNTKTASIFGSGWGWLVINKNKELEIITTPNQDSPLMQGLTPLLGVDVWEHAYYLKYQNKRPDYLANIWQVVNWLEIQERYEG